ncbi:leukocyte immunoglobulin-like receptor subfamily B member 3 [Antechinus flavipes]|uniref:leukocyte immunoglobulin-like receptor subfamily B member 3 n=1 Tax=Antechinus flavipes TaxID=38775 RepID=UPI00223661BD|nr:leukocyte immunoglobulin-like receptor subfamily B member 3 [Antechinus flavipes]
MSPALSALLCLGLCLGHRMRAQEDELPRPSLRAENGSLGPLGRSVTFRCRGSPGAAEYFLEKELGSGFLRIGSKLSQEDEVEFSIPSMTLNHAGTYFCRYRTASDWSELSDPLELVATDRYGPPSLSAWPSSAVAEGEAVTLRCYSGNRYDRSALYKDGEQVTKAPAQLLAQGSQADFPIPAVNFTHGGTYRCYSFQSHSPHEWSAPSDPLELRVTGTSKDSSLPHSPGGTQALTPSPPTGSTRESSWPLTPPLPNKASHEHSTASGPQDRGGSSGSWGQPGQGVLRIQRDPPPTPASPFSLGPFPSSDPARRGLSGIMGASNLSTGQTAEIMSTHAHCTNGKVRTREGRLLSNIPHAESLGRAGAPSRGLPCPAPDPDPSSSTETNTQSPEAEPWLFGLSKTHASILLGASALLILLFLLLLLLFCCRRHRARISNGSRGAEGKKTPKSSDPAATPMEETLYAAVEDGGQTEATREDTAAPRGEDPQQVTYAQLDLRRLGAGAEELPPSAPEAPSLYAALR